MPPSVAASEGLCCPTCRFPDSVAHVDTPEELGKWYKSLGSPTDFKAAECMAVWATSCGESQRADARRVCDVGVARCDL